MALTLLHQMCDGICTSTRVMVYLYWPVPWNALGEDEDLIPSHGHKRPRSAIMDESGDTYLSN